MNQVSLLLKREIFILKHRWLRFVSFWILFPLVIFVFGALPLYKIIPHQTLDYLHWVMPGIWIVTSAIVSIQIGVARMHQLKMNNYLHPVLKSPITIGEVITGYFLIAVCYGLIQLFLGMTILILLNQGSYTIFQYVSVIIQILCMILFISGLGNMIGLCTDSGNSDSVIIILVFIVLSFGFGGMLPIQLFPRELSSILNRIPIVILIKNTQNILLLKPVHFWGAGITAISGIFLMLVNVAVGHKLLKN